MQKLMMALIVFTTTVVGLYIFNIVFGAAFDQMYLTFNATQSSLALPLQWAGVANAGLARWKMVYQSVVIIVIAMGVWVVLVMIGENTYERQW
jgi:hypothetical protein